MNLVITAKRLKKHKDIALCTIIKLNQLAVDKTAHTINQLVSKLGFSSFFPVMNT